jgi:hypothetical protein
MADVDTRPAAMQAMMQQQQADDEHHNVSDYHPVNGVTKAADSKYSAFNSALTNKILSPTGQSDNTSQEFTSLYNKESFDQNQESDSSMEARRKSYEGQPIWKIWNGNNKFWCGGKIMTGPDLRNLLSTVLLITIPISLFLAFPAVDLIKWGKYNEPGVSGSWAVIVASILYVLSMIFLAGSALRDPGIIPPNHHNAADESSYRFRPRIQEIVQNGIPVQLKYCDTCNIYRPPRAVHCSICNNCMDTFDHHVSTHTHVSVTSLMHIRMCIIQVLVTSAFTKLFTI